jgi:hypothetical protein
VEEAKTSWGFAAGVVDSAEDIVNGVVGLPWTAADTIGRVQECGGCALTDVVQSELESLSNTIDDLHSGDSQHEGHAAGEVTAFVFECGWPAGGATKAARFAEDGGRIRIAAHGPRHSFGPLGNRPHIQINWWKAGQKGSGGAFRLPWPF